MTTNADKVKDISGVLALVTALALNDVDEGKKARTGKWLAANLIPKFPALAADERHGDKEWLKGAYSAARRMFEGHKDKPKPLVDVL